MNRWFRLRAFVAVATFVAASSAHADSTVVTVNGNTAQATITLSSGANTYGPFYVTITFNAGVTNLTPGELNLTAQVVDPSSLAPRLPSACVPPATTGCVSLDPAFPVLVQIEPLTMPYIFHAGFEDNDPSPGNLNFLNTYTAEIETDALPCAASTAGSPCQHTPYRLFKAPVGGSFSDITTAVLKGSVRARGDGGTFSQFMIVADTRDPASVAAQKSSNLRARINSAALNSPLQSDLIGDMDAIDAGLASGAVTGDYSAAINADLSLIAETTANAGSNIANVWSSDHTLTNDAGEILSQAKSLLFSLNGLNESGGLLNGLH